MKKKIVVGCVVALLAGCRSSSQSGFSWNGLSLGMPFKKAAPIVQRICGAKEPLQPRTFPEVETSIIGCGEAAADFEGKKVGVSVQFYQGKVVVIGLSPRGGTPREWWTALEKSLDEKYGPGTDQYAEDDDKHAREWKTKDEWIRTNNYRQIAFAARGPLERRTEVAKKQKEAEKAAPAAEMMPPAGDAMAPAQAAPAGEAMAPGGDAMPPAQAMPAGPAAPGGSEQKPSP